MRGDLTHEKSTCPFSGSRPERACHKVSFGKCPQGKQEDREDVRGGAWRSSPPGPLDSEDKGLARLCCPLYHGVWSFSVYVFAVA